MHKSFLSRPLLQSKMLSWKFCRKLKTLFNWVFFLFIYCLFSAAAKWAQTTLQGHFIFGIFLSLLSCFLTVSLFVRSLRGFIWEFCHFFCSLFQIGKKLHWDNGVKTTSCKQFRAKCQSNQKTQHSLFLLILQWQ